MTTTDKRARLALLEGEVAALRQELGLPASRSIAQEPSRRERLLLDAERAAHFGSWTWSLASNDIFWSDELYRIFGLTPGSVAPSTEAFFARVHPDDHHHLHTFEVRAFQSGTPESLEFRIARPNGEVRTVHMEASFVDGRRGERAHLVGTLLDVTDQKRTAALLAQTVDELNEAQRLASMGSWRWRLPERRVEWSQGMYRLLGIDESEPASEELFYRHVHPDDANRMAAASERAIATQAPFPLELRLVRQDGAIREALMYSRALTDEQGNLVGFYGTIQDITDRKILEASARHAQKMEAVGTLAGGVAHDFNNYLQVLGGHLEVVTRMLAHDHAARPSLSAMEMAQERCVNLTEQLLTLSRKREPQLRSFDLAERVRAIAPVLRSALGPTIELQLELSDAAPLVHADPAQVEHALMNLTLNARDVMAPGKALKVSLQCVTVNPRPQAGLDAGDYVRLSVADEGSGIPPELMSRIFEPFFTTKPVGKGTGLGLAVVYGIVRAAGGGIEVESVTGQGTTFHLYFQPGLSKEREAPHERTATFEIPRGRGQRILLVEDSEAVRELLAAQLKSAGYEVLAASDGKAALGLLDRHVVDALLSDVVMPNMGGVELVRTVRARRPNVRCLLMSGHNELAAEGEALPAELLHKPFSNSELTARIAALFTDPGAQRSPVPAASVGW